MRRSLSFARLAGPCLAAALTLLPTQLPAQWIRALQNTAQLDRGFAIASDPITLGFSTNIRGSLADQELFGNQVYVCTKGFISLFPLSGVCPIAPDAGDLVGAVTALAPYYRDMILFQSFNGGPATTLGRIFWGDATVGGRAAWGVTWEEVLSITGQPNVNSGTDHRNTFQLMLIERSDRAVGDFDVEFNYGFLGLSPNSPTSLLFAGAYDIGGLPDPNAAPDGVYDPYTYAVTPASNTRVTMCWVGGSVNNNACAPSTGGPTDPVDPVDPVDPIDPGTPVPEPSTSLLIAAGLGALLLHRLRRPA